LLGFGLLYTDSAYQSIDFPRSEKAARFLSGTGSAQADAFPAAPQIDKRIMRHFE